MVAIYERGEKGDEKIPFLIDAQVTSQCVLSVLSRSRRC